MGVIGKGSSSFRKKDVMEQNHASYGYIYLVTNLTNDKSYVGKTLQSIELRWKRHLRTQHKSALHKAIDKYGLSSFEVKELCRVPVELLNQQEQRWISKLNTLSPNGYNLTLGGDGSYGFKHDEKAKDKMSKAKKGKPISKITKLALEEALKKNHPRKGVILTEETKVKISKANTGHKMPDHVKSILKDAVEKPIECFNKEGFKVAEFTSTTQAYAWLGKKCTGSIGSVCRGERKSAYGYIWKFRGSSCQ